jgi:NADP-dependent 3-hydroxy acid dehydrogenase YdfG
MSQQFKGKKLLVVGGSSGMGFATAKLILQGGGSVVIVGNKAEKTEQARQTLAQFGEVCALTANLADTDSVDSLLQQLQAEHQDIDLLVNAAGVFYPKSFLQHTKADYEQYMRLNQAF